MLRHTTTLVLGAGASNEVGMPLGADLKAQIAALLEIRADRFGRIDYSADNYELISTIERLEEFKKDKRILLAAARQLTAGMPFASSIDHFLEIRRDNPAIALLAKSALVQLILKGERESNLTVERFGGYHTLKPTAIDGAWYQEFAQLFFEQVGVSDIEAALSQLSIIDFNYDRCFEQVLFYALTGLYNLPHEQAGALMAKVQILHPYGAVGTLHVPKNGAPAAEFGEEPAGRQLELASGIRTFTERMMDTNLRDQIRGRVAEARTVVFLGCAYHPQNMELVHDATQPRRKSDFAKLVFGTTFGMSEADKENVTGTLNSLFSQDGPHPEPRIFLKDAKSADFLRQYRRTLSAD